MKATRTVEGAIGLAKGLRYRVVGKAGTNRAQVSRGGLANGLRTAEALIRARA